MDIAHLLTCLGYPQPGGLNLNIRADYIKLVRWLEDRKIRELEINERQKLRENSDEWDDEFMKYLERLGCPIKWNPDFSIDCLHWLVSHAISVEYEDEADDCADVEYMMNVDQSIESKLDELDLIGEFIGLNRIPHEDDDEYLERIVKVLKVKLSMKSYYTPVNMKLSMTLDDFPLELDTGDTICNKVVKILKMLHILDLRALQSDVNSIIISGQEFTANPKTNTALGKVGR
mmetsp:Transcript_24916/g.25137  ORF Transcript_24916/g.25137 Transcript_24916/m.25137 type:complete len:232 (+) Transcript_24916:100-795(+)